MSGSVESARVVPDAESPHPTLFSLAEYSQPGRLAADVCRRIGLNRLASYKLHEDGWLSFDPRETAVLTPMQEAELTFVGSLAAAGCDDAVLRHLLAGLRRPYAYRVGRIYYDWTDQRWRLLNEVEEVEENIEDWIEELLAWREMRTLERLRDAVEDAIEQLRERQEESERRIGAIRLKPTAAPMPPPRADEA